jgi:hypothetical protein
VYSNTPSLNPTNLIKKKNGEKRREEKRREEKRREEKRRKSLGTGLAYAMASPSGHPLSSLTER